MNGRLAWSVFVILFLGAGVLYAQTAELKAYLDRGRALTKAEKPEQALPYFLFALELGEKQFGADSPAVVPLLNDLAEVYATRSDYPDAEPLFKRSLAIQEQELTRYRSGIARTLNNLGSLYEATARPREARKLYRRVVTALQPALGRDDPSVKKARLRLAKLGGEEPPPAVAEPAVAEVTPPTAAAVPPAAEPTFRVHLTSIRKPDGATREWRRLRRAYPKLLSGLEVAVTRVGLGAQRGVWYRVQGGPLDRAEARALCDAFKRRGVWCQVLRGEAVPPPPTVVAEKGAEVPPTPSPPAPAAAGFRIHLTSIRNPVAAGAEWARLRRLFKTLLADLGLTVARADLGAGKGVWYRIQGGPLGRTEARARCAGFAQLKLWCRVVPPPGTVAGGAPNRVALRVRRRGVAGVRGTRRPRLPAWPEPGARRPRFLASPEPGARRFADPA